MDPVPPADTGLVTVPSGHDAASTVERLKALLAQKGIELFAHVDHAAGAKKVGLPLRPTRVLIFGNPLAGTPLMQSRQSIGLDLPLRVLVWEDDEGKPWLTYRPVEGGRGAPGGHAGRATGPSAENAPGRAAENRDDPRADGGAKSAGRPYRKSRPGSRPGVPGH